MQVYFILGSDVKFILQPSSSSNSASPFRLEDQCYATGRSTTTSCSSTRQSREVKRPDRRTSLAHPLNEPSSILWDRRARRGFTLPLPNSTRGTHSSSFRSAVQVNIMVRHEPLRTTVDFRSIRQSHVTSAKKVLGFRQLLAISSLKGRNFRNIF
ncbi:hypothetical protein SCHPADRAFT_702233 [Schizopora paradoxa]|uniref:Uncharacterized protein n=1 Tax=Schizopora paradoxa TaxID=27342 RepID=A0A0H2RMJ6_9AGAM|nr:hypothetical protein SCHPADRAFT_702233 [Schizopora paradoxa]